MPIHGNIAIFVKEKARFPLGTGRREKTALCSIILDRRVIKGWLNREAECTETKCTSTEDGVEGLRYRVNSREARTSKGLTIVAIHFEQLTIGGEMWLLNSN